MVLGYIDWFYTHRSYHICCFDRNHKAKTIGAKGAACFKDLLPSFYTEFMGLCVIVTLTDDSVIYGDFSTKSFASSDPEERDLFIEKTYIPNEKGEWIAADKNEGIYIHKDQIKTIEFLRGT